MEVKTTMRFGFFWRRVILGAPPPVMPPSTPEITQLLRAWSGGDQAALDRLVPLVYGELRRVARRYMRRERPGHSLQTTALVNEVYLRLVDVSNLQWQDR